MASSLEMRFTDDGILKYRISQHNGCIHLAGYWREVPSESANNDWLKDCTMQDAEKALKNAYISKHADFLKYSEDR